MTKRRNIFAILVFIGLGISASAQNEALVSDSIKREQNLTILEETSDSIQKKRQVIESPIDYDATDSISITMENGAQIVYLYKEAIVKYGSIELTADYIVVNFDTKEIYAEGVTDSLGNVTGKPHFKEANEEFDCSTLRYNFETGKGFTENVITEQQDGIVHSAKAKMMSKEVFCMVDGKYSTCDADHPHFYLHMTKGKIVKDKSIISGRAYMVLEDFPIYFPFLPYGLIPTFNKEYSSGVIIPSYGQEDRNGFYLRNGGFYWAASDYFDLKLTGDVYTSGKWALNAETRYRLRYKFSGNFRLGYSRTVSGYYGVDQTVSPQFSVVWSHSQDAKANPSQNFSASVNFSTSGFDKEENWDDPTKVVQNTKSSSISYRKNFVGTPLSLTANIRANQNTKNQSVDLTLPSMTLNMKSIQPLKRKKRVGGKKWYEDFKLGYSASISNTLRTTESELFSATFNDWDKSVKHSLPITLPSFTLLDYINVVPSVNYREQWYFDYVEKYWVDGYYTTDNAGVQVWVPGRVVEQDKNGFKRFFDYSYSLGTSTTLYGMYTMKNENSKLVAVRHKMDPTLSFSYSPDFTDVDRFNFYEMVQVDSLGGLKPYNIFTGSESLSGTESGSINFGLSNNIEMKLKNDRDTTSNDKYKKVAIFDNLSFRGSYNLAAEQFNLSTIALNARTKIAGTSISVSGTLDPYALDARGDRNPDMFTWNDPNRSAIGKIGRLTSVSTGYSMSYSSDKLQKKLQQKRKEAGLEEKEEAETISPNYVPFRMPWRVSASYTFSYRNTRGKPVFSQSVNLNGGLDLTDKWSTSFTSNFDIMAMKLTHTNISITRNLHCWTMSFSFAPVGTRQYYMFTLAANSSMLRDVMKVERSPGPRY